MNKRALNHFFSKQAPQSEGSTKKAKYRLMHLFAVGILSVQMLTSAVAPVYQVAAETTTQTSQTTETASTEQTKPTTSSEPAASSAEAKTTSESSTEPAEETDPAKVRSDLLKTIAQFGDTAGTTVTVADKAIKIELSPKLSKKAEEIKKAITPLVPDGYKAEITAKQADLQSITNLDQLTEADIKSLTMTWSQDPGAATTTGTAVYPTGFVLTFNTFENGRTATWKPGDTITIPNLTYTGAYGDVSLEPNFVRTTIAGLGYIEGNTITVTNEDIGKELAINFGNLKKSDFASFTTDVKLPAKADVTASFLGQELKFTAIDQSASWTGQIGEVVKDGEVPGERDFSFQYSGSFFTGDKSRDLSYGAAYHDAADFSAYVNKVNDETKDYQGIYPLEPTMKKLAETPGNLFMVNTYPATEANKKILTVTGSNLFTKSTVGAISGLTNDGLHPMVGGEGSSLFLVNTTTRYFEPGTTKAEMKAALAVGETGYSKQADGSFISLVNMGNYSSDGDHISYADVSYPNSLWPAMIRNQHMQPADSFNATDYQAKMVAADGAETPPLFAAQYLSTITVEDPSDGTTTYDLNSTIEGMDDAPVNGTSSVYTPMKMDPATISTEGLAAIKISYKSGDTIVGQSKTIYAEPGTTFDAYKQSSPNEVFFPDEFKVDPFTYRKTAEPTIKDFGAVGTTTNIVVEYEPLATLQLNYKAGDKTIAGSKLIYDVGDTNLKDYLTANADSETNSEAKLFPKEIKNGTTTYRLKDSFDPAAHTFGAGGSMTSVDVEYEKLSDIGFWTPHEGYDLTKNTGTYGDTGLELYVSSEDPWLDRIVGDPTADENKTKVLAKGIFGYNSIAESSKWYIDTDNVLHIGSGATAWLTTENSPWLSYKDEITKVQIEGKLDINPQSKGLFGSLDKVTSYTGLENFDFTLTHSGFGKYGGIDLSSIFKNNTALTDLSGEESWNLSKVTKANSMFESAGIETLDAPNWGFDTLTEAYGMFLNAKDLTAINGTENWKMTEVTTMWSMFNNASSIERLDLSSWNTGKVAYVNDMFTGMTALKEITFGETFKTSQLSSGNVALPNTTSTIKWRNVDKAAGGTIAKPMGTATIDAYDGTLPDTYVLESGLGFWTPQTGYALDKNTGTYGDAGLENYIYSTDNPWLDRVVGEVDTISKVEVKAKGIFGPDVATGVKWYIDMAGVLHLSPGAMRNTDGFLDSPWYQYKDKFTTISVDGKITLNANASYLFDNLTQVTKYSNLDQLDLSKVTTVASMFMGNESITELNGIDKWDTAQVTSMNSMFRDTKALTTIGDTLNWDTSKVTNMGSMFQGAGKLVNLDTSGWNTGAVTNMSSMFNGASSLTSLNTSSWNTSAVTTMNYMFNGASSLTSLNTSSWNTSNVTNMGSMFNGAAALTTLNTKDWNTENVTTMNGMFNGATVLTTLDTSNWKTDKVANMANMFQNAKALTELDTSGWNTENVTTMGYMFNGASSLTALDTSGWKTPKVTTMRTMFQNASSLTKLDFSSAKTNLVMDMNYMFNGTTALREITFGTEFATSQLKDKDQSLVVGKVDLPNTTTNVKWRNVADGTITAPKGTEFLSAYASAVPDTYVLVDTVSDAKIRYNDVNDTDPLTTTKATQTVNGKVGEPELVTLYDPWTSPELKDQPYVFAVENSTTTGLPDPMTAFYRDPLSVTILNGATATGDDKVVSLQKVQAKGIFGDVKWYIDMEGTLHIGSGTFGEPDDSAEMISPWMVYNDIIDDVIIDGSVIANTDSTALFGGLDTESISGLENIDVSNVTDMGYMFSQMTNLSKLDLSSWDTSSVTNMTAMFAQNNFSNVDLGTWETENVTDMSYMFAMSPNLTSLATPNWNTEKVTTMIGMFTSASALTELDFTGWNTSNVTDMTMMLEPMDPSMPMALKKVTFDSTFATSQLAAKAVELPNTTDSLKWQNLAGGTVDAPKGTEFLTAYASVVPDTYVLVDTITDAKILYNDSTDSNVATKTKATQALSGKIGETETVDLYDPWTSPELKDQKYVFAVEKNATTGLPDPMTAFSRDPLSVTFQTTTDDDEIVNLQPVKAKGIFGDVKWYIDTDGTLHIGSGTFGEPVLKNGSAVSPWVGLKDYDGKDIVITKISIDGDVTANKDSSALFQELTKVTEILGLDKLNVSNVTNMDSMFNDMQALTKLDISSWDTTSVTDMSKMFSYTMVLPEITFGADWDTTNVTEMDYMFGMMSALSKIDLEGWNTSNVTTMEGMFLADESLTVLDFSSFDTHNVTDMTQMLFYAAQLKQITFGEDFVTEKTVYSPGEFPVEEDSNGQVVLPNTTDEPTVTRWQNVGDGTVAAPTGDQHLSAYAGAVPDTYVLTSGTIKPILPDTGSDQRLIALISASALIVLGLLGVVWYKRKDSEIER